MAGGAQGAGTQVAGVQGAGAQVAMVPMHPESIPGDDRELRWVIPSATLAFVGATADVPAALQALCDDGTVESLFVEPTAVRVRLGAGRDWRSEGARVRAALQMALVDSQQWHPFADSSSDDVLRMAAAQVLSGDVGDYIRSHGGGIRVLDVTDGQVTVELTGTCSHCPAAELTLAQRFEAALRELYPALRGVRAH